MQALSILAGIGLVIVSFVVIVAAVILAGRWRND